MTEPIASIDPSTIASVIEANINAYRLSVASLPGALLVEGPTSIWVDSGIADATLNAVVYAGFEAETVDRQIDAILSHFRQRSSPVAWHIGPTSKPLDLGRALVMHGMIHEEDEPGMAVEIDRMRDDGIPPGLTIQAVQTAVDLADWVAVWLFPVPEDIRRRHLGVLGRLGVGDELQWRYYLGRLDGEPVATSKLFVGSGVAAVHHVVTLPAVRRRGIGSAMTRRVLHDACALGYRVGVLTASPYGIGSYRRIGFREYCTFSEYRWEP